jgi:hypothetical protein
VLIVTAIDVKPRNEPLPDSFIVSVVMEQSPSQSAWADHQWEAVGVSAGGAADPAQGRSPLLIHEENGIRRFLYPGFRVKLYQDECESYYHNLMCPTPRCYVVADPGESDVPVPVLVSLSFDEAHAYLEGGQTVYAVAIPPELYRWSEAFILHHYVPEKKKKRKLTNWRNGDRTAQ